MMTMRAAALAGCVLLSMTGAASARISVSEMLIPKSPTPAAEAYFEIVRGGLDEDVVLYGANWVLACWAGLDEIKTYEVCLGMTKQAREMIQAVRR